MLCLVAQSCPTLCEPTRLLCPWGFSRQEYWSGQYSPMHSSRGTSHPRDQIQALALQADSLLFEPQGKPKNTGVGSLSLLQGIFLTQESSRGLLHCKWILYQLSYQRILVARKRAATDHLLPACRKSLTHFFCVFFVNE